ncbi:SMP-30/gluconolactonase/LRE family protein [Pollutimonas sp. M17]|uniref:SMP-30/gluconolactonase/LRE family protein n=1 Tax=Pollutimonas sp. M17 TaxID=2962065 RepID=UPI0021F41B67|nr:SMP-30/gluconolactonase/LRE family protein [Pollutimonas sp. M17]UYO93163.1 SMP-30/gluconolactonase/LRE family protein [Pollutimonas sp. M17]
MFATPQLIAAEVFARYPQELKTGTEDSEWNQGQPTGFASSCFLEGPSFDRNGVLWCVDVVNGRLLNVSPDGSFSVAAEYDGWPNGLKIRDDGLVFIADYKNGIMVHEPGSKKVRPYLARANLERFKAVNDLFFASNGDLFFTDQGLTGLHDPTGKVFRLSPDGHIDCLLSNVPSPNGLVMDLQESTLYLAATRANAVWRVPIVKGKAVKVGTFLQLSGGVGPDGLALDAAGGLAVAHAGLGAVWLFSNRGEPLYRINTPAGAMSTNVAYGGPQNKDLFITESASGQIFRANLAVAGNPMFSHRARFPSADSAGDA